MAKNDNKSKAELYREERKKRIAKANKKNAKKIATGKAAANVGAKILAIILVAAIVVGIGVWGARTTGIVNKLVPALTIGDTKVSAAEFNYYYYSAYQQTVYYNQMYSQYGMSMGYNEELAPNDESNTTTDADGNTITWNESFIDTAKTQAQNIVAYNTEAAKENFELDQDKIDEIEETITSYSDSAEENGFSLSAYLKASFGAGFNEKNFREMLEQAQIADAFRTEKQEQFNEAVAQDEIDKEYKDNQKTYDYTDIRYYTFTADTLTAEDGESDEDLEVRQKAANEKIYKDAEGVYKNVKDAASLEKAAKKYAESEDDTDVTTESKHTTYESINSAMNEKVADWVYSKDRKAGDKKLFKSDANAYIVVVEKTAYQGHSVDVRHCLVGFEAEDEDNVTDEEKKTAKEKAEKLLAEWKEGEATEETFITMVEDNSTDEGSVDNGGLYEGMRISDSYVEEFLDWSFDSSRKAGDVGIIETTYGYHIMYFSKDNKDDIDQLNTIRENLGTEDFEAWEEELLAEDGNYAINAKDVVVNYVANAFCKKIKRNLASSSNS